MMINATDGYQETVNTAKAHIKACGYTFPVYFDVEYSASRAYYVSSLPATYFIDADGNIKDYAIGMISGERLQNGIKVITK